MKKIIKYCLLVVMLAICGCSVEENTVNVERPIKEIEVVNPKKANTAEKKILLISQETSVLTSLNQIIVDRIDVNVMEVDQVNQDIINQYDVILLGDAPVNNQPSEAVLTFLNSYNLSKLSISPYWVGAMNNEEYEVNFRLQCQGINLLPGLGLNEDELSMIEEVTYIVDGWLTSVNTL